MPTVNVEVKVSGALFTQGLPARIIDRALNQAIVELLQIGEQRLDMTLRPRPAGVYLSVEEAKKGQASTGHYRRSIHAVTSHLQGIITDSGVVYGPWLEGVSNRNITTRFKGYASFRRVGETLKGDANRVARAHIVKAVRELNR